MKEPRVAPHDSPEGQGKALWGGRFSSGMAPEMVPFNVCLPVDGRLWREDILGSSAWTRALSGAGVITAEDMDALLKGLDAVASRIEREGLAEAPEEDIHSVVERMLREAAGDVAGKLHTGRSRNDQSSTDVRLWGMGATDAIDRELVRLARGLLSLAESGVDAIMPGYTHLQQGQPIRAAQWALAHLWPLLRDGSASPTPDPRPGSSRWAPGPSRDVRFRWTGRRSPGSWASSASRRTAWTPWATGTGSAIWRTPEP